MRRASCDRRILADGVEDQRREQQPLGVLELGVLRGRRRIGGDDLPDPLDEGEAQDL